jgi:hypothetical protein
MYLKINVFYCMLYFHKKVFLKHEKDCYDLDVVCPLKEGFYP